MGGADLVRRMRATVPATLADIETLVTLLGVAPERIVLDGWTHLRWRVGRAPSRVLLLGLLTGGHPGSPAGADRSTPTNSAGASGARRP